jgi:hypothetical protein
LDTNGLSAALSRLHDALSMYVGENWTGSSVLEKGQHLAIRPGHRVYQAVLDIEKLYPDKKLPIIQQMKWMKLLDETQKAISEDDPQKRRRTECLQVAEDFRQSIVIELEKLSDDEAKSVDVKTGDSEPMPNRNGDKYKLGPGRRVTRNGQNAELSPKEFLIVQAIKFRESVPLGELMRPSHDDAIWQERYSQDDRQQTDKIRKAISRLDGKLSEAGVSISLRVSPPDLIVTYR